MWLGVHGTVTLELGEYLIDPYDADRCFEAQLVNLMIGAGDQPKEAASSVAVSGERYAKSLGAEVGDRTDVGGEFGVPVSDEV
jgi:hypothetical protein